MKQVFEIKYLSVLVGLFISSQVLAQNGQTLPSARELFSRDSLKLEIRPFIDSLDYKSTLNFPDASFKSSLGREIKGNWALTSTRYWRPMIFLGLRNQNYKLTGSDNITQTTDHYWSMGAGLEYRGFERLAFKAQMNIAQYPFLEYRLSAAGEEERELLAVSLTQFSFLALWDLWQKGKWKLELEAGPEFWADKRKANFTAKKGLGLEAEIDLNYWFNSKYSLGLSMAFKSMWQKVKNDDFESKTQRRIFKTGLDFERSF